MDATSKKTFGMPSAKALTLLASTRVAFLRNISRQTGLVLPDDYTKLAIGLDLLSNLSAVALGALPPYLRSPRTLVPQVENAPPPVVTEEALRVARTVATLTAMADLATTSDDGTPLDAGALEEGLRSLPAARGAAAKAQLREVLGVAPQATIKSLAVAVRDAIAISHVAPPPGSLSAPPTDTPGPGADAAPTPTSHKDALALRQVAIVVDEVLDLLLALRHDFRCSLPLLTPEVPRPELAVRVRGLDVSVLYELHAYLKHDKDLADRFAAATSGAMRDSLRMLDGEVHALLVDQGFSASAPGAVRHLDPIEAYLCCFSRTKAMISVAIKSFAATPNDDGRALMDSLASANLLEPSDAWASINHAYMTLLERTDGGTLPPAKPIYMAFTGAMIRALKKARGTTTVPAALLRGSSTNYLDWLYACVAASEDKGNELLVAWAEVDTLIADLFRFKESQTQLTQRFVGIEANIAATTGSAHYVASTGGGTVHALTTDAAHSAAGRGTTVVGLTGGGVDGGPNALEAAIARITGADHNCPICNIRPQSGVVACFGVNTCAIRGATTGTATHGKPFRCTPVANWVCPVCTRVNPLADFWCNQSGCMESLPAQPTPASAVQLADALPRAAVDSEKKGLLHARRQRLPAPRRPTHRPTGNDE